MKKILFIAAMVMAFNAFAQSSIMRGEVSPGVYTNIKTDALGNLFSSPVASPGTFTNRSGAITTGGVSQVISIVMANRKYFFVQNTSAGDLWINFSSSATLASPSIQLIAGASYTLTSANITTESINIIGATTSQTYTAKEM